MRTRFIRYLWSGRSTRTQVVLTFGFMVVFGLLASGAVALPDWLGLMWQSWMELLLATGTILVAAAIWHNEKKQDWENSLPKRLHVSFRIGPDVFYRVENAPLVGENDVRAWGQQLGQQMNDGEFLLFRELNVKTPYRAMDATGQDVMRYELTIWLQKIGEGKKPKVWCYGDDGRLLQGAEVVPVPAAAAHS